MAGHHRLATTTDAIHLGPSCHAHVILASCWAANSQNPSLGNFPLVIPYTPADSPAVTLPYVFLLR